MWLATRLGTCARVHTSKLLAVVNFRNAYYFSLLILISVAEALDSADRRRSCGRKYRARILRGLFWFQLLLFHFLRWPNLLGSKTFTHICERITVISWRNHSIAAKLMQVRKPKAVERAKNSNSSSHSAEGLYLHPEVVFYKLLITCQ